MLLDGFILKCSSRIQMERTPSATLHILTGKKSIQTMLDLHIYSLEKMYGIYPSLRKDVYEKRIKQLMEKNLLAGDMESMSLTDAGYDFLRSWENQAPPYYFNGYLYSGISASFAGRLLLSIQTFTNMRKNHPSFIPIVDEIMITDWVKRFYQRYQHKIEEILHQMHEELHILLTAFSDREAHLFVDRLTGHRHFGKSMEQLQESYGMPAYDIPLLLEGMTHKLMDTVSGNHEDFPLLHLFIENKSRQHFLTKSARQTYELWLKGFPPEQIALKRNLKLNTIHDHIVELALYDRQFPLSHYVNEENRQAILYAITDTGSFRLKDIKTQLDETISYFQIRLVIATMKG